MSANADGSVGLMNAVPAAMREGILSGMRWTLWLAVLAAPFSYGTNILLARVGPEAIGTYGLISLYISLVTAFLYLGGDPVAIRFMPAVPPRDRFAFFLSYLLIICTWSVPWFTLMLLRPDLLHYLLGTPTGDPSAIHIFWLAPLYILFSLLCSSLRGVLEIRAAQAVMRIVPLGTFFCYAAFYIWFHNVLRSHYTEVVWIVYFGMLTLATLLGLWRVARSQQFVPLYSSIRFCLPNGFWRYVCATQQLGILSFAAHRLDYLLVLHLAGLANFGKYVAVTSLALTIRLVNGYFVDTLLPSLTNLFAAKNPRGASSVFVTHFRILLLVNIATTCGLIFFASFLIKLLGPLYTSLEPLIIVMALFAGLAAPGGLGGPLLYSVGKQQKMVYILLLQLALFVSLFLALWPWLQLLGAIIAYGSSHLVACILSLIVAKLNVPIKLSTAWNSMTQAALLLAAAAVVLVFRPLPLPIALLAWVGTLTAFLLANRYTKSECGAILRCFLPQA